MRLQVLEKVFVKSKAVRLVREALYIKVFESEQKKSDIGSHLLLAMIFKK